MDKKQSCKTHSINWQTTLSNNTESLFVYSVHKEYSRDIKAGEQSNMNWVINLVAQSSLAKVNNTLFRKKLCGKNRCIFLIPQNPLLL